MLPPHLRHRDLNRIRDLSRRRMRPMRTIHQPAQLLTQIAAQPTVNRRPVHPDTGSNLGDIRTGQHRTHRVQTLLDNRQDNQSQSRPPRSKTSRGDVGHRVPKQTAVADHLANACRTSVDGGHRAGEIRWEEFLYELKAGPTGGRLRRPPSAGDGLPGEPPARRADPSVTPYKGVILAIGVERL